MIFYVATNEAGRKFACKTQEDARLVNKIFTKIDVPTDKDGLHAMLQEFFDQLDALKQEAVPALEPGPAINPKQKCDEPLKDTIAFCSELTERWPQLPWGLKSDLCCLFLEDVRAKLKPTKPVIEPKEPNHAPPTPNSSPDPDPADSPDSTGEADPIGEDG